MSRPFTVGTHNMADRAQASPFAALMGFTEAAPIDAILDDLPRPWVARECKRQKSLAFGWDASRFQLVSESYRRAHGGTARITPGRGTWALTFREKTTGQSIRVILSHRINNAFGEVKRPGRRLRERLWKAHYELDARLVVAGLRKYDHVIALGDLNRSDGIVYPELRATRRGYDRIAWGPSLVLVGEPERLSGLGSDHDRLRVTLKAR